MPKILDDLLYGARTLRKSPAFTLTAAATLALGIGASTAIFSVVDAVLLRPLPYGGADRLALISQDLRARGVVDFPVGGGDIPDIRSGTPAFEDIAVVNTGRNAALTTSDGTPELVTVAGATTNVFRVLDVPVLYGRDFTGTDGTPNPAVQLPAGGAAAGPAAAAPPPPRLPLIGILGYDYWQRRFGGDRSIIGRSVTLFGQSVEIVGVASPNAVLMLPSRWQAVARPDVWTALRVNFDSASRMNVQYRLIGRLRPGASIVAARTQIARVSADLRRRFAVDSTAGVTYHVEPMKAYLVQPVRTAILALMGAVIFVLLIACANVANLLLVRAARRERELAVRAAIGGSPWSIVRQLLAESLVLASISALAGVALAEVGIRLLLRLSPGNLPRLGDVGLDGTVLGFTVASAFVAAILFGLAPAIRASSPDIARVLRSSGRSPSLGGAARLRSGVIVAEVALSFVLLVGSGLMVRSFSSLLHTDPGFRPDGMLTFGISNVRLRSLGERDAVQQQIREKLAALPGVTSVTTTSAVPLDGSDPNGRWGTLDAGADPARFRQGGFFIVAPGYFETMRTPLIAGRAFLEADNDSASHAVVIDDATAKLGFGGAQASLGKTILARIRTAVPEQFTVIGVVAHQRHLSLSGEEKELLFFPAGAFGGIGQWVLRTTGDPTRLGSSVRGAIASVNPSFIVAGMKPVTSFVDDARAPTRFALVLIGIFAGIAAVLAAVGLYGVLSSVVRQRTSEIGIRMAFGASAATIFGLVIGQGLRLTGVGIVIGLVIALASTRVMSSMLVGVRPTDPLTFAAMAAVFVAVAAVACWAPARRAAALDPNVALRQE